MELRASGSTIPHASPLIKRADELRRLEAALELAESGRVPCRANSRTIWLQFGDELRSICLGFLARSVRFVYPPATGRTTSMKTRHYTQTFLADAIRVVEAVLCPASGRDGNVEALAERCVR